MGLTEHNGISIAQIVVFIPALAVSIFLCIRHGFGRNAGWLLIVIFSLARVIGASLQLATISQPANVSLYFGALTLQGIGLSNLIVALLALINRAVASIEKARSAVINPRVLRVAQVVVLVALILGAVGGSNSGNQFAQTGEYVISPLTQAGTGLTIAGFVLLVLATVVVGMSVSHAEPGEKRVVGAVALCLPFLLVRLIYSAVGTYQPDSVFNSRTGDVNVFLGTAVVEEIIIVLILEAMGLTLNVLPKSETSTSSTSMTGLSLLGHLANGRDDRRRRRRSNHRSRRYDGYEMPSRDSPHGA
ncbi:hypothetical protein F5Y14DRAFT_455206 [Nemania sp. NC0429]|nr:hypothetical protein F5Y14DRAFT_455206 [Nemania sp. NC0429]